MIHSTSAGGIVLNKKGQVIIVAQKNNTWSFPKGHLESGETALQAAEREISEESGITQLTLIKELGKYQRYKMNKEGGDDRSDLKTITLFLFTTTQEKLHPLDPQHSEARWVNKEDITKLLTHQKDKDFFESVKSQLNSN
ncbi:MAG TPA: NUDIX domain-containing protein [Candidatus Nanoarchaeia archaeon]|nr:NUDIX domain-containing protein [Candidatus Nanoarchaeia archaeon]